jgi:hypothetical protein
MFRALAGQDGSNKGSVRVGPHNPTHVPS